MSPVDETPEILEADYIDPMAPLDEEGDVPALSQPSDVPANNPTHRRLRAIAGADVPYVLLTFPPNGQVSIDFWGMDPPSLSPNLQAVADATRM